MLIGKSFTFDAAHRLLHHNGKCHNLHGHTYKVEVTLNGQVKDDEGVDVTTLGGPAERLHASDEGMVLDFGKLKEWWAPLDTMFDHALILDEADPLNDALESLSERDSVKITQLSVPPTAENLAYFIREDLTNWLHHELGFSNKGIEVAWVRVYETPTSWAEA